MKSLNELIHFLDVLDCDIDTQLHSDVNFDRAIALTNLQLDSRQLQPADVFIAIQGLTQHGLAYLQPALQAGVACVLTDRVLTQTEQACLNQQTVPPCVIVMDDLVTHLATLANWYYDQPSQKLKVVGITGTNGKTSSAHYLVQLLLQLGQQPALIGTLGNGLVSSNENLTLETALNTTPDVVSVHRLLHQFYVQGANWVVMEVSSHALELGRIEKVEFEAVALTQVTRDHLDFHGTEQAYRHAKSKLFTDYVSRAQVVNLDDSLVQTLMESGSLSNAFAYSIGVNQSAKLLGQNEQLNATGIALDLVYQNQTQQACLNLMGKFNIENVLCAMSVVLASGFNWRDTVALLQSLNSVSGRMQKVANQPTVIVDFAHTPDALKQVLQALKQHVLKDGITEVNSDGNPEGNRGEWGKSSGKVVVVFGCGGDRDTGKRPLMANVAENNAQSVVLTSDNPRFESPDKIIADTLKGFEHPERVTVISNRQLAIESALHNANPCDVILIAGKGHERYQDIAGIKHPFSDQQVVLDWINQP